MKGFCFYFFSVLLLIPASLYASSHTGNPLPDTSGGSGNPLGQGGSITIRNPLGTPTITGLFETLLQILLVFAVPIVVFFIIYAGFLYVTARGNVEQITKAHRALLYALIGGVLILGGTLLIQVVQNTVNAVRSGT